MNNPMIDKNKHHRAHVSFLKFLKPRIIPTMQEAGGISKGHIATVYQNGLVNVSNLKVPIINIPQKDVAIIIGRCITILIIPWIRNELFASFIFTNLPYHMFLFQSLYLQCQTACQILI